MTLEEQVARRRAVAHRLAVGHLMDDLRHAGLDIYWENGDVPRLSDGRLTPWPTLAARHPHLAVRLAELFGPGGEKTVSAETEPQLRAKLPEAGKGQTRDVLSAKEHQGRVQPVSANLRQPENGRTSKILSSRFG